MILYLLKKADDLRLKQKKILHLITRTSNKNINLKVHNELSPLGWHIIHCIFKGEGLFQVCFIFQFLFFRQMAYEN